MIDDPITFEVMYSPQDDDFLDDNRVRIHSNTLA